MSGVTTAAVTGDPDAHLVVMLFHARTFVNTIARVMPVQTGIQGRGASAGRFGLLPAQEWLGRIPNDARLSWLIPKVSCTA